MHRAHTRAAERGRIATGCLIAAAVGLVVALGGGYACYRVGIGMVEDEVAADLADNPVVQAHLGEIREIDVDLPATGEMKQEDRFAFRVVGSKASGLLRVDIVTGEDGLEHVTAGTLTLDDGTSLDLFPAPEPGEEPPADEDSAAR